MLEECIQFRLVNDCSVISFVGGVGRLCMKSRKPAVFVQINETPEFYFKLKLLLVLVLFSALN